MFVYCYRACAPCMVAVAASEDKMLETLRAGIKAVAVGVRGSKPIPEELGKLQRAPNYNKKLTL
jgi:hypothetical protein